RLVDAEVLHLIQRCFEEHRFPKELIPKLASLGLLGSSLTGYECAGLNAICYGLICQELERGDSGIRSFVSVQSSLCMYPIWAFGTEEQKQRYLPRMARGELIGCFGLTEPHGGSDPANMKTHAKKRGADWVVNGSKMWITNGSIADLALVWAMTPDGLRGFLIEKGTPGFSAPEIEHKFSPRTRPSRFGSPRWPGASRPRNCWRCSSEGSRTQARCNPRTSRSPSGTTAAWRSTSRATAATCWAAPASAPSTCLSATC